jgi:adenine/guanine phosphoribosyltransferase-like PRPP-binding protein
MRRIILACALADVLGVPAKADETLKFHSVVLHYVTKPNSTGWRC